MGGISPRGTTRWRPMEEIQQHTGTYTCKSSKNKNGGHFPQGYRMLGANGGKTITYPKRQSKTPLEKMGGIPPRGTRPFGVGKFGGKKVGTQKGTQRAGTRGG